ncbi:MAG: Lrp/AsnC family transcriptional regulator [Oscillospiraceae bacterium]|nr:Lrp/AsnC family transcriptional regulator [Oscillospiraceae bacterium]
MDSLLQLLKQNARFTDQQLADMLGTTQEAVAAKIKEYEQKGIIMGYSVILNDELADKDTVTAFIEIRVTPQRDCGFDDLAKTIMMYDEVESVSLMSGGYDLAVTASGSNLRTIALFVSQKLSTIDGVISTATHFVLRRYKEKGIFIDQDNIIDERGMVSP